MKALIIDNEVTSRTVLRKMIEKYCPQLTVIGEASSTATASEFIAKQHPDLVFLDIEMPDGSGFDLLKHFPQKSFHVIFTSAYDQYALKAIKYNALDYLLKPIDINELIKAVEKVTNSATLNSKNPALQPSIPTNKRIGISTKTGVEFIYIEDIVRCEADGSYTKLFMKNNKNMLATGKIKGFEEVLANHQFVRVHNSHLININFIEQYIRGEGGFAIMSDKGHVPISRRKKDSFLKYLCII